MDTDADFNLTQTSINAKAYTPVPMTYIPPPGYYPVPQVQPDSRPVTTTPQVVGIQSNHSSFSRTAVDVTQPVRIVPETLVRKHEQTRNSVSIGWVLFGFAVCLAFVIWVPFIPSYVTR